MPLLPVIIECLENAQALRLQMQKERHLAAEEFNGYLGVRMRQQELMLESLLGAVAYLAGVVADDRDTCKILFNHFDQRRVEGI